MGVSMRICSTNALLALALVLTGCGDCAPAGQVQTTVYYAQLGVQLNQVEEQGFPPVMSALTDAVADPALREASLGAADSLVDRIDAVVEASRPANAPTHAGYQAARRMVEARRRAVADLRQGWQGADGPETATDGIIAFSSAWMRAQQQFMSAVGASVRP